MNSSLTNSINFIDNHFDLNGSIINLNKSTISLQSSTDSFTRLLESDTEQNISSSSSKNELFDEITNSNVLENSKTSIEPTNESSNEPIIESSDTEKLITNTEYLYTFIEICKINFWKIYEKVTTFFSNTTSSFFAKTKETFKEDNENSFAIKNFKIQDTILLSKKLFINRNKGQPNIYVFYKTKNI